MKKIWIVLISVVVSGGLVGGGTYYLVNAKATKVKDDLQKQVTDLNAKVSTAITEEPATFEKDASGYHGTVTLTGYIQQQQVAADPFDEASTAKVNYVKFVLTKSNSSLIDSYLSENKGNSYVGEKSIGIGCYDEATAKIHSSNEADSGTVENSITGADLSALLGSTTSKQIKLQLTKPVYTSGRGGSVCYSHFREFKIVQ